MPRTFTGEQRRELARKGMAMSDGGYPIRNVEDLKNAIQAYGRGTNPPAVKKWIKKRAKELDAEDLLPENWEISHSDDELMHYGVKGMKWGVRRYQRKDGPLTGAGKRRLKKALRGYNSSDSNFSETKKVYDQKVAKPFQKSKERQDIQGVQDLLESVYNEAKLRGIDPSRIVLDPETTKTVNTIIDNARKKGESLIRDNYQDLASATLRDAGFEDTQKGRDWLISNDYLLKFKMD